MWWIILLIFIFLYLFFNKSNYKSSKNKMNLNINNNLLHNSSKFSKKRKIVNDQQLDIEGIELSEEQRSLFDKIENSNEHIFITGKAGTGKSVLLQYLKYKSKKSLVVCAYTGVAALNVGAQTINSLFNLPWGFIDTSRLNINSRTATLLRHIDMLVIDEISMVRADMMDAIDVLLQQARGNNLPFGGIQIVMFGDLYQLPPIVNDKELHRYFAHNHDGFYFFNAHVWKKTSLNIFELTNIFRQKDEAFKNILNTIRKGKVDDNTLSKINERAVDLIPEDGIITLAATNDKVDSINYGKLNQIDEKLYEYKANIAGEIKSSDFPADEILSLKKGAQVMLLKNDRQKRWVNGTIGFIDSLSDNEIKVNIDGIVYPVSQQTWNKTRYYYDMETRKVDQEIISSFTQFPLRLAWAITIHKSQGKTYNSIVVDVGSGAFAHGQTYVALSRCVSLDGLYLRQRLLQSDIIVDNDIVNFMTKANIEKI